MAPLKYNDNFFYNVSGCKVHKYSTPDQEYLSQKHKRTKDELVKIWQTGIPTKFNCKYMSIYFNYRP